MTVLEARGLVKTFAGARGSVVRAVEGVDLAIGRGELIGLAGESGSGKSTLGKMLVRLIDPSAGEVWFEGRDLTRARGRELAPLRRKVQMVFQDPYGSLNPRQTIEVMLREALRYHAVVPPEQTNARVGELLERVGLRREVGRKFPHELSGGQRQRAGIARALSVEPQVLIADEPVSALDVSIRAQVLNLLLDLRDHLGLSVLLVSHDLRVLEHVCDRIEIMYRGAIVERLPAAELREAKHDYTRTLLAAIPRLP